jgi:hypothetical protein
MQINWCEGINNMTALLLVVKGTVVTEKRSTCSMLLSGSLYAWSPTTYITYAL